MGVLRCSLSLARMGQQHKPPIRFDEQRIRNSVEREHVMSKETIEWLNENTMIGFTKSLEMYKNNQWMHEGSDGVLRVWWEQPDFQHKYDGAIPVEAVRDHLFNWTPVESVIQNRLYL